MLVVEDCKFGLGLQAVLLVGIVPDGLLLHVVDSQGEDRKPIDHAAGSFAIERRVRPRRHARVGQFGDEVIIQLFDEIISPLVQPVDVPFDLGKLGVGHVAASGNVLLVPKTIILLMLTANQQEKAFVGMIKLALMPPRNGRLVQIGNGFYVDQRFLSRLGPGGRWKGCSRQNDNTRGPEGYRFWEFATT